MTLEAQVGRHGFEVAVIVLLGAEGDTLAAGERHAGNCPHGELGQVVVAGAAGKAIGWLSAGHTAGHNRTIASDRHRTTVGQELRQAGSRVALRAGRRHHALSIPVTERHRGAVEVPSIVAGGRGKVDWRSQLGIQVCDRIVHELDDILGIVRKLAWILAGDLVVVRGPQEARSPGAVGLLACVEFAVGVGICKEVRVGCGIVANISLCDFLAVCRNGGQELLLQTGHFSRHAFFGVAIAVVVHQRAVHADVDQVFDLSHALVAIRTLLYSDLQGVLVMAAVAGIERGGMLELAIVHLAVIFVAAFGQCAVLRGRSRKVVDIAEAKGLGDALRIHERLDDRIHVRDLEGVGDHLVHAELGLTALVTFHTTRLATQVLDLDT